jgi:hypothetical protein
LTRAHDASISTNDSAQDFGQPRIDHCCRGTGFSGLQAEALRKTGSVTTTKYSASSTRRTRRQFNQLLQIRAQDTHSGFYAKHALYGCSILAELCLVFPSEAFSEGSLGLV